MKNRICTLIMAYIVCLLLLGSCRQKSAANDVDRLPDLPQDLVATLDPKTMATRIPVSNPEPVRQPGAVLAPCCASTDTMTLKVNFSYTKCGPLRDFIVAPFEPAVKAFKLRSFNGTILNQQVCFTSQGPWNAKFIEERHCNGFTPQDTLLISAFGDLVSFVWSGGTPNHPQSVQLVSCREVGTTRFNCGISTCDCQSSSCPPSQPCDCGLLGW